MLSPSASSSALRLSHDGDGAACHRSRRRHQESRDPPRAAGDYPLQGPGWESGTPTAGHRQRKSRPTVFCPWPTIITDDRKQWRLSIIFSLQTCSFVQLQSLFRAWQNARMLGTLAISTCLFVSIQWNLECLVEVLKPTSSNHRVGSGPASISCWAGGWNQLHSATRPGPNTLKPMSPHTQHWLRAQPQVWEEAPFQGQTAGLSNVANQNNT